MTLSVTAISGCPGELSESVMEYRISHLWVTSSNAKGHEKPLSSGGLWESFQAISATTNGTCPTNTHCIVSQGKAWKLTLPEVIQVWESMRLMDRISSLLPPFIIPFGKDVLNTY